MFQHNYIKKSLSRSRFLRLLYRIDQQLWQKLLYNFKQDFEYKNKESIYLIDSFPVPVCAKPRTNRTKLYKQKFYKGFNHIKDEFFRGVKVHMLTTKSGFPVEYLIEPACKNDMKIFSKFTLNIRPYSSIYADKGYNSSKIEAQLFQEKHILLIPQRKVNAKIQNSPCIEASRSYFRKRIETTFSLINQLFPKKIHAITERGFELKISLFIIAYAFSCLN
jgi:hypothetical protein